MGFDPECLLNLNRVPLELFCPVCRQLVYPTESQQTSCGHIYCQSCISYVLSSTRQCPLDGALLNSTDSKPLQETNPLLHNTLGLVGVRCLYYRSGCSWQGELVTSLAHTTSCSYGSFPVQCNRCGQQILHRQVHEHARTCHVIASQVHAPQQISGQQNFVPNSLTSQTEQQSTQNMTEVNAPYLQQAYSANMTDQHQQQQQQQQQQPQQVLDGRQLQNAVPQEQQVLTTGQMQGAPQSYSTDWHSQQYYQQQYEQHAGQITMPQQQVATLVPPQYPEQQAQHDNAKLQLLQEQQKSQQLWVQQQHQSGWDPSSGNSGLQHGHIAAPVGTVYQQIAAGPSIQQYAAAQQLPPEKYEQEQQFSSQANGLPAQPPQQMYLHMRQTPTETVHPQLNPKMYSQQHPQTHSLQENPVIHHQQQQHGEFPYQAEHHQPYVNPQEHHFSGSRAENLSLQNDPQQRHLSRNVHGSRDYPRHLSNSHTISNQQEDYQDYVHHQSQTTPFDQYQQHPLPPNYHQQHHHVHKQTLLPMTELEETDIRTQPIYINSSHPHSYSPLQRQHFFNSQSFPQSEEASREGDERHANRLSFHQYASPGRSLHTNIMQSVENNMEPVDRQQMKLTNLPNDPEYPRETTYDVDVPLATYIQQQQNQLPKQRAAPEIGIPFVSEHDHRLRPPSLEQGTDKQLNWNQQPRPDIVSSFSQGGSLRPLDVELLPGIPQAYNKKTSFIAHGPSEQSYPPHPQMRPPSLISYGRQPDAFRQFPDIPEKLDDPSQEFISRREPYQTGRPLSGYRAQDHEEYAEQADGHFNRPFVDEPHPKRYSEELKHALSLVAKFGVENTENQDFDERDYIRYDKHAGRGDQANFSSQSYPLEFMSGRLSPNAHRLLSKPNEFSQWSNLDRPQEEHIPIPLDPLMKHLGPNREFSRLSHRSFEDQAGLVQFPSEVRALPDPFLRSQLMPIQDIRPKFDYFDRRIEPRFMHPEHPVPWTRAGRGMPGLPPELLGTRNMPILDTRFNSSRLPISDRERLSLPAGRPLFFDSPDSRFGPPSRRFRGLRRQELSNGNIEVEPYSTTTNDDRHDHGRKRKVEENSVRCRICEADCVSVQGLEKHSQSAEHQKMAMQLVLSIKDDSKRTEKEEDDEKSSSDKGGTSD